MWSQGWSRWGPSVALKVGRLGQVEMMGEKGGEKRICRSGHAECFELVRVTRFMRLQQEEIKKLPVNVRAMCDPGDAFYS